MKSLIIGSQGLIGSALARRLPDAVLGVQMEAKKKNQIYLDLIKYETMFKAFSVYRPQVVYLAASITDIDSCENYGTSTVNVKGAIEVLRLCEQFESTLVFYSSSYVFDGNKKSPYSPFDELNPVQMFGKQKQTVENVILQSDTPCLIIRTVGVFGQERKRKNFAQQVLRSVFSGRTVYTPIDQYMNPILSDDLAEVTLSLLHKKQKGILHVAGDTCLSKYEFAKKVAGYFGYENKVVGINTSEMKQRAIRPSMGCLDCSELLSHDLEIPSFDLGLQRFLGGGVLGD